jgi:aminomethyltransferase
MVLFPAHAIPRGGGACTCAPWGNVPAMADTSPADAVQLPLRSPLYERHQALGAKMADFGGFQMPIEYPGGGVVKEHTAVREAAGVFDVSHLGKAVVRGPGAAAYLNTALSNDLGRIAPGQAQYTLCCDEATGGVVDDLIAYLRAEDEVLLVPNAANTAEVVRRLAAAAPGDIEVENLHTRYGVIAVQGPRCEELLAKAGLPVGHPYMSFVDTDWQGRPVTVCRTGYTGERGYELLPAWEDTGALWDALLDAGEAYGARPVGLGARDTLRTEMGYPLHGQDLSLDITPVQARLGWAVGWRKPAFWGREVLVAERERGARRLLRGVEATDRGIPRPGMAVRSADGAAVGRITSGTFSPTRRAGIGLALLDRSVAEGDEVRVDIRGRESVMRVVRPPFVQTSTT